MYEERYKYETPVNLTGDPIRFKETDIEDDVFSMFSPERQRRKYLYGSGSSDYLMGRRHLTPATLLLSHRLVPRSCRGAS
jgi:hypothetical protein